MAGRHAAPHGRHITFGTAMYALLGWTSTAVIAASSTLDRDRRHPGRHVSRRYFRWPRRAAAATTVRELVPERALPASPGIRSARAPSDRHETHALSRVIPSSAIPTVSAAGSHVEHSSARSCALRWPACPAGCVHDAQCLRPSLRSLSNVLQCAKVCRTPRNARTTVPPRATPYPACRLRHEAVARAICAAAPGHSSSRNCTRKPRRGAADRPGITPPVAPQPERFSASSRLQSVRARTVAAVRCAPQRKARTPARRRHHP